VSTAAKRKTARRMGMVQTLMFVIFLMTR
jgi:hypothetical protein